VRRDLLNLALGNRDNHGRNTAILKDTNGTIRLAPLFDFGPAFLDARALARVIHWDGEDPRGTDWNRVLATLQTRLEEATPPVPYPLEMAQTLREFAIELNRLPELMRECGVDRRIIEARHADISRLARELEAVKLP
jgi:serine/threonine-protein kinase HipA